MNTTSTISETSDIKEVISSRRTIHNFKPTPPAREVLIDAIDLARWAPNHKLTEPWKFYILGKQSISRIAHFNADLVLEKKGQSAADNKKARLLSVPSMLVVSFEKCGDPFREKEDYAATCCAVQNMTLALWSKGIGVKWSTSKMIRQPGFYDIVDIDPNKEEVVGLFFCGYPDETPTSSRKPVGQIFEDRP